MSSRRPRSGREVLTEGRVLTWDTRGVSGHRVRPSQRTHARSRGPHGGHGAVVRPSRGSQRGREALTEGPVAAVRPSRRARLRS
eukprot:1757821-Pyramimonas_sp.AAC.1